jgi:hypothetical protein
MERMFVDPETGDMHPESYYHQENIDLATVIEAIEIDGRFGFKIDVENIERMNVKHPAVFAIFSKFVSDLLSMAVETDDENMRDNLVETMHYVSNVMLEKMSHAFTKH